MRDSTPPSLRFNDEKVAHRDNRIERHGRARAFQTREIRDARMLKSVLTILQCPACGAKLHQKGESWVCENDHAYSAAFGMPVLIYPSALLPSDAEFQQKYEEGASRYDEGMDWLFKSFFTNENDVRSDLADELHLRPGSRVLEISAGTGGDSKELIRRIGDDGLLVVTDLSPAMLRIGRDRLHRYSNIDYVICNGSYLPFADGSFDAVFHFGGINEFGEKERAIDEMARVIRPGGRVVFGDESVPPWLRNTKFGRTLIAANRLYQHEMPLDALPPTASDVRVRWVLGGVFYLISFNVSNCEPRADYDLPIPGKRDTLRERFKKAFPGEDL